MIIAYYYPPNGTVAFLRNYHIVKYLKPYFKKINIITLKNIPLPLKDKIDIDSDKIHRVFNFDYRNMLNFLSGKKDIRKKANEYTNKKRVRYTRSFLDNFPFNTIFGEGGVIYIITATIKGISLIKKNKVSHIYSSYRPVSDHIIAYNLKLFFPDLIWIADFRDPPIQKKVLIPVLKRLQSWFLKKLLSKPDIITSVSDGVTKSLRAFAPQTITFRNGIYNLFEINKPRFNKFTISYTGSLYLNNQNPKPLFDALNSLLVQGKIHENSIQIIYAGKDSGIWTKFMTHDNIKKISIIKHEISLKESIELQHRSHINLLLTWSKENKTGILTGKFFEYLSTGNPVLTIITGKKDTEIENFFTYYNCGKIFYPQDTEKLEQYIYKYYRQWQIKRQLDFKSNEKLLKKLQWENQIKKLVYLL